MSTSPATVTSPPQPQQPVLLLAPQNDDQPPVYGLVKKTPEGALIKSVSTVRLTEAAGEIYRMSRKVIKESEDGERREGWEKVGVITAAGYYRIAKLAGMQYFSPPSLMDGAGGMVGNPHTQWENGEIVFTKVRRVGWCLNPLGSLVVCDLTVTYDLRVYLAQDVWSKWIGKAYGNNKNPQPKDWGACYPTNAIPPSVRESRWIVNCLGSLSLALDLSRREVLEMHAEHINRQKFAERNAVTICDRNIAKKLIGITYAPDSGVQVIGWLRTDDIDPRTVARDIVSLVDGGMAPSGRKIEAVVRETEQVEPEDIDAATIGSEEPEPGAAPEPDEEAPPAVGVDVAPRQAAPAAASTARPEDKATANMRAACRTQFKALHTADPARADAIWKRLKLKPSAIATAELETLETLYAAIDSEMAAIAASRPDKGADEPPW